MVYRPTLLRPILSASQQPDTETCDSRAKDERLADYLRPRVEDGELYFKSKFIAEDVDLSLKEISALIVKLQDSVDDLSIERWSYAGRPPGVSNRPANGVVTVDPLVIGDRAHIDIVLWHRCANQTILPE